MIAPRWVLTAAHCVDGDDPDDIEVLVGTHDLEKGGRRVEVKRILMHEGYSNAPAGNDIALIELARPAAVPVVELPSAERAAAGGHTGHARDGHRLGPAAPAQVQVRIEARGAPVPSAGGGRGHFVDGLTGRPVKLPDVAQPRG